MITIEVRIFGPLRDVVGTDAVSLSLRQPCTAKSAFEALAAQYPHVRSWRQSVRVAVNLEYVAFDVDLHDGDEISFIPPVSGG